MAYVSAVLAPPLTSALLRYSLALRLARREFKYKDVRGKSTAHQYN